MALIKCLECGKDVSSYAKVCPNCGFPISNIIDNKRGAILQELEIEDADYNCSLQDYVNDCFDGDWDLYEANSDDD